ncbi:MAG TPA: TlpA disulfide reductase family protein [Pyrinomonadaceae bacterium]|nr:TlpA disulfide reductase family protein [Pyrinomonadaceae bacterium]
MNYKIFLKILIVLFLMLVVIAQLTGSINYNSLVSFFACFLFTVYCLKKFGKEQSTAKIFGIILAARILIDSYTFYLWFAESVSGLPYFVMHLLAIASGFLYLRLKSPFHLLPILLASFFTLFMFFQGWHYWIHRAQHGTFTGRVSYSLPAGFEAFDEGGKLVTEQDFNGKIVLLDFWHTRCGYCFAKFPQVEKAYQAYKNDSSVMILAVNKPLEVDKSNQAFEIIREEGHSFPVVITKDADMSEKFGVFRFPAAFVINQTGVIVYRGDIEGAVGTVEELKRSN